MIARLVLRLRWLAHRRHDAVPVADGRPTTCRAMPLSLVFPLTSGALLTFVAMRFGLLSLVVTWFTWGLIGAVPMTLEFSHWRADAVELDAGDAHRR